MRDFERKIIAPIEGKIVASDLLLPIKEWSCQESPDVFRLQGGNSYIQLRKFSYPETFVKFLDNKIICGYKDTDLDINIPDGSLDSEFLLFEINLQTGLFRVKADALTSLPVCYCVTNDALYLSYNLIELLKLSHVPIEYNLPALSESLLLKTRYNNQSILKNVYYLTEREELSWDSNSKIYSKLPPSRKEVAIQEIDDESAVAKFTELLNKAVKKKLSFLQNVKICTELSGGLDSAIVTQALISMGATQPVVTFSKILPDIQKVDQTNRLHAFAKTFPCKLNFIDLTDKYPLANLTSIQDIVAPFDPTLEPYRLGAITTAEKAQEKGCQVLFSGMGGDELLERSPMQDTGFQGQLEAKIRQRWVIPNFFTEKIHQSFLAEENIFQSQRIPFFTHSVMRSSQVKNSFFLERGIWPVAVLANSELVNFCRSLPNRFLKNKKIIRMYQQQTGFPEIFYNNIAKDSMYLLHRKGLEINPNFILDLFAQSRLAQLGFVDKDKLIKDYQQYLQNIQSQGRVREYFYEIIAQEIFLISKEIFYEHGKTATTTI